MKTTGSFSVHSRYSRTKVLLSRPFPCFAGKKSHAFRIGVDCGYKSSSSRRWTMLFTKFADRLRRIRCLDLDRVPEVAVFVNVEPRAAD